MVDGIKILFLPVNRQTLWNNPLIEPRIPTNAKTGEISNEPPQAEYQGLTFIFYPMRIEMKGSIHKYFNKGFHNYNDFDLGKLKRVIIDIQNKFNIEPHNTVLNNIEIGVNVELPYNPKHFLKSLIMHRGEPFTFQTDKNKRFRECSHTQFFIKAYDKGKQYKLNRHILRFEGKFIKMERLNKLGIKTLSDLIKPGNFELLGKELLSIYDDMLIGNLQADYSHLNAKDRELFIQGHNPEYWQTIKPETNDLNYKSKYKVYERRLTRFQELLTRTGANHQKNEIRELIIQKIHKLCNPKKTGEIDREILTETRGKLTDTQNPKTGEIDTLLYRVKMRHIDEGKNNKCLVTGIDISAQRKGSKFISEKTVRDLYFNNPETFEDLFKRFASKRPFISKERQCYFIAHNIRNTYFRTHQQNV